MNIKKPIYVEYNLDALVGDSKPIRITHIEDSKVDVLELCVRQGGQKIDLSGSTVTARIVLHGKKDILLNDNVVCTVSNGNALIPFDNAVLKSYKGVWRIEINLKRSTEVLTLPHPLWIMVNDTILATAEVSPESEGTIPELLKKVEEELKRVQGFVDTKKLFDTLDDTLSGDSSITPALFVKEKGDNYALVYTDSKGEEHELFDFSILPIAKGDKGDKGEKGDKGDKGEPGTNGSDGFSPTATVTKSGNVSTITITGKNGTTTANVNDGTKGDPGANGADGNAVWKTTVAPTNPSFPSQPGYGFNVTDLTGADREVQVGDIVFYSYYYHHITQIIGSVAYAEARVSIRGANGATGAQGPQGDDYVLTTQDKTDIADIVLSELPTTQEVLYGSTSN